MAHDEAEPPPGSRLDTESETGAGIEVEDEAHGVSHRVGYRHMGAPHQQQIHAILYQCGGRSYDPESDYLAQLLSFVSA